MLIKMVIIGFAHMHVNEAAQYIMEQPETQLIAAADIPACLPENTDKRYTRAWNIKNVLGFTKAPLYEDYRRMLDEVKPDYAYILCENYLKPDVACECAKRGVSIIIEKPMAADLKGAEEIAGLRDKYGIEISVNWPVAWRAYLHEFKNAVDSDICGKPLRLRYINGHTGPLGKGAKHRGVTDKAEAMTDSERSNIWWYHSDCGGGALLDILCYGCYFARWFFKCIPESIYAYAQNLGTPYADCEDNTAAVMRYDGKAAVAEGSWTIPRIIVGAGPQLLCTDGAVVCEGGSDSGQRAAAYNSMGETIALPEFTVPDSMKNMPWHIAAHLKGEPIFETLTLDFNIDVMKMLDAAVRSSFEHSEIKL